ncbi:hypothetical protein GDO86_013659 [Hymenochirus boettgeri]|uniref:C-type lectin domain-containing protein n=1 Tax=Hymenochirus boettgeri TaxID=247094 RepID=A0A8T2IXP7_9PIPI|nr:hypothetical protein GDO86_013659 [Hymenochirus boettgeri]
MGMAPLPPLPYGGAGCKDDNYPEQTQVSLSQCGAPCGEDWIWYRGKCYYFSETYSDWDTSQSYCAFHNASLALIDSQEEMDFLRRFKGMKDHWIGLHRDVNGESWVLADGSSFNNTFQITGESPCVSLNNVRINSVDCYGDRRWICNKRDTEIHRTPL